MCKDDCDSVIPPNLGANGDPKDDMSPKKQNDSAANFLVGFIVLSVVLAGVAHVLQTASLADVTPYFAAYSFSLTPGSIFFGGIIFLILRKLFIWCVLPLDTHKTAEEVEGLTADQLTRGSLALQASVRARRTGDIPPPYPNGWYRLMDARDLKMGDVKYIQSHGQHLAVFRGSDGKPACMDAYCPHLGANMAVNGKVKDDCLECPFHGWKFDAKDGKCVDIPYAKSIPEVARVRTYPVVEANGLIIFWFHADKEEPHWYPRVHEDISAGSFHWHGRSSHYVRAHIQELPENGPDNMHLDFLHSPALWKWLQPIMKHTWSAAWAPADAPNEHLANITLEEDLTLFGWRLPFAHANVTITQCGPGLVYLEFAMPIGRFFIIESVSPCAPMLQRVGHIVWAEWKIPRFVAKIALWMLISQFERDVPIWNNKTFLRNPLLIKEDGPIAVYRRWFAKNFYSKGSYELAEKVTKNLDW